MIYFARAGSDGPVKIGFSRNAAARIADLTTVSPAPLETLRIIEGDYQVEAWLHRQFSSRRRNGEWFDFCDEMLTVMPPMLTGGNGPMETFRDVIAAWPNLDAIKADTGAEVGAIKQWRNRDNIPGEYWLALEVGAAKRSIPGITMHILGRIALAKRPPATDSEKPAEAAA